MIVMHLTWSICYNIPGTDDQICCHLPASVADYSYHWTHPFPNRNRVQNNPIPDNQSGFGDSSSPVIGTSVAGYTYSRTNSFAKL